MLELFIYGEGISIGHDGVFMLQHHKIDINPIYLFMQGKFTRRGSEIDLDF